MEITIETLIEKLQNFPKDHVIDDDILNKIHGLITYSELEGKYLHLTLDCKISINDILESEDDMDILKDEISRHNRSLAEGLLEVIRNVGDQDLYDSEIKAELV